MSTKIETVILQNLINDDEYMRKVIPFLKRDYFLDTNERIIYDKINSFIGEYNSIPSKDEPIIFKSINAQSQYKMIRD